MAHNINHKIQPNGDKIFFSKKSKKCLTQEFLGTKIKIRPSPVNTKSPCWFKTNKLFSLTGQVRNLLVVRAFYVLRVSLLFLI
jgi:hypothetical protein